MTKNKISPAKEQLYNLLINKVYNSPYLSVINDNEEGFIQRNIKFFVVEYVNDYAKKHGISETEAIIMCSTAKEANNIALEFAGFILELYDDLDDSYILEFPFDTYQ